MVSKYPLWSMQGYILAMGISCSLIEASNVTTASMIGIPHDASSDPSIHMNDRGKILPVLQENKSWIGDGFLSLWEKSRAATDFFSDGTFGHHHHYTYIRGTDNNRYITKNHIELDEDSLKSKRTRSGSRFLTNSHKQMRTVHPIGWIPAAYPNPLKNPDQCRVSAPSASAQQEILLCDPDGILSPPQLNMTSNVLQNFTQHYGTNTDMDIDTDKSRSRPHEEQYNSVQGQGQEGESGNESGSGQYGEVRKSRFHPEIGVAVVSKMDLPDILHDFAFYTFEDEDDMIHDAAEYFADYLHSKWFSSEEDSIQSDQEAGARIANGILIFISVDDYVCFISAGNGVAAVLPWWRLLRIVDRMNESMHYNDYFDAVIGAVHDISSMLDEGPPSTSERVRDFLNRFGAVLFFTSTTICLAMCGEYRDNQKRYDDAESLSAMDEVEEQKAKILQNKYKTDECPICLEPIHRISDDSENDDEDNGGLSSRSRLNRSFRSYGLDRPIHGNGDIKMLRCGHIFHYSCWKCWIMHGSNGDQTLCPVCRQDIARKKRGSASSRSSNISVSGSSSGFDDSESEEVPVRPMDTMPLFHDRADDYLYGSIDEIAVNNNLLYEDEDEQSAAASLVYP